MSAPIVVHSPRGSGSRRGTVRGQIVRPAHDDAALLEFLRRATLPDAEGLLDDLSWVLWRGSRTHHYEAA
ncbi:hypothetical protein [Streptomyces sp. PA5.6]|uniref:hypothetical protein n=1 Tax=Streptomyces sp. PA5.6 TaxID=3035651 RepID=UPI0039047AAA